eukprot:3978226-Pyramimonas_sp.AAC.1
MDVRCILNGSRIIILFRAPERPSRPEWPARLVQDRPTRRKRAPIEIPRGPQYAHIIDVQCVSLLSVSRFR